MSEEQPFTILVVDDNPVTRVLCSRVLTRAGFRVAVAEDGIEALRLAKEKPIDLVLLDVMMPGLSGFDVLETLRKLYSPDELRILMLTAKDQSTDVVRAFELGADDYITKPLDVPVMIARVQARLRSRTAGRKPAPPTLTREPGTVLEDKYRLESVIGRGTFGTVYRATHLALERPVAVKVLNAGLKAGGAAHGPAERGPTAGGPTEGGARRFHREAISACRIDHPNAVSVLDLALAPGGVPFLVMELLEGRSLADELTDEGPLSLLRCAEILTPVCAVLAQAHALGIIHRDVKPQNVFLHRSRQGEVVKVLDFGIAKLIDDAAFGDKLTLDGIVGTPTYMAPERFSERASDDRADVYSLGVMLYEMLSGRPPFESGGELFKLIVQHMNEGPVPLTELRPELPPAVERVVSEALAKQPAARPSAASLAERFAAALSHDQPISLG